MKKEDLMELAGLIQTSILDNLGIPDSQKKVAERLIKKVRAEYRGDKK